MKNLRPIYFRGGLTATDPVGLVTWYLGPKGPQGGKLYYTRSDVHTGSPDEVGGATPTKAHGCYGLRVRSDCARLPRAASAT